MEQRGVIKKEGGRREGRGRKAERPSGADLMDAHKHDSPSELSKHSRRSLPAGCAGVTFSLTAGGLGVGHGHGGRGAETNPAQPREILMYKLPACFAPPARWFALLRVPVRIRLRPSDQQR